MSAVPRPPQASCLCGSAPCILCACCPASRNSTVSRLIFTVFLFLGVLVSIIMLSPGVESQLYKVSGPGGGGVPGLWGRPSRSRLGGGPGLGSQLIRRRWAGVAQGWRWGLFLRVGRRMWPHRGIRCLVSQAPLGKSY